jgi:hypothetical protein
MAFQKSFKGSRLFSFEQEQEPEQTWTLHCFCCSGLGWNIVTIRGFSLGLGWGGGIVPSMLTQAAHGQSEPVARPLPASVSHLSSPIVIKVPQKALHALEEAKSRMVMSRDCTTQQTWVPILDPLLSFVTSGSNLPFCASMSWCGNNVDSLIVQLFG